MTTSDAAIAALAAQIEALTKAIADTHPRPSYRAAAAARMVGVSESTITKMVRDGRLRKVPHLGTAVVIPHSELLRVFGRTVDELAERRSA